MAFTHSHSYTFTKAGESFTQAVSLTGAGEIDLDGTCAASSTLTFAVSYVPNKVTSILVQSTGSCSIQAKDGASANLGSALVVTAVTTTVLGVSVTKGVAFWYTGSNTGVQPLCNTGALTTAVASLVVTDTSAASNPVSIRILYNA